MANSKDPCHAQGVSIVSQDMSCNDAIRASLYITKQQSFLSDALRSTISEDSLPFTRSVHFPGLTKHQLDPDEANAFTVRSSMKPPTSDQDELTRFQSSQSRENGENKENEALVTSHLCSSSRSEGVPDSQENVRANPIPSDSTVTSSTHYESDTQMERSINSTTMAHPHLMETPICSKDDINAHRPLRLESNSSTSGQPGHMPGENVFSNRSLEGSHPDNPTLGVSEPSASNAECVGFALKQWSVYLQNMLLSFIHKECNNRSGSRHHNCSMSEPYNEHNLRSPISDTASANSVQVGTQETEHGADMIASKMESPHPATIGPLSPNVAPSSFCPCCHYHNQMSQSQTANTLVSVSRASGSPLNSQTMGGSPMVSSLHNGYYNYVANPFFQQVNSGSSSNYSNSFLHQSASHQIQHNFKSHFVQGKDPSMDFTQDIVEESEDERFDEMMSGSDAVQPIELPPCEIGRLEEISELVSSCLQSPMRREKLAVAIENEGYIKKLLNVFRMCEDLDNMDGLHHLYEIFKNIFLLNKNALFELMFAEDTIFDVIGCLEFDPNLSAPKRHRQYLKSIAKFHQVININNPDLLSKIHQTYRVQYIQDVVLPTPSVFEENMLSTLSSFIFFNKVEIVSLIQEDEKFLTDLFNQLTDGKTEENARKESVLFLKEFCTFSQTLQPQSREAFFKTLSSLGILPALEITLASENRDTKAASIDILLFIVEFSPSMVREYMLQQLANSSENDTLFMNVIIEQMTCDTDPEMGGAVQLMVIIRTLLEPENMLASVNKSEKTDFLNYFYKHCMHVFIAPLMAHTASESIEKINTCTVQLLSVILELLSFFVEHHTYHIKNYILHKDLLRRILLLGNSQHTFLVLCAIRFMRKIIALKDEFYNRYIIKGNLFAPVIKAFISNNGRYNLLDSAVLEMFEFIKSEDIKSLCSHVVESFGPTLDKISYVQTFKALKLRYDQNQDRLRDRSQSQLESVGAILRPGRFRRDPRDLDEDEEMWFNDDEYDDQPGSTNGSNSSSSLPASSISTTMSGNLAGSQIPVGTTAATLNQQSSPPESNGDNSERREIDAPEVLDEETCSASDHKPQTTLNVDEVDDEIVPEGDKTLPNGINASSSRDQDSTSSSSAAKKGLVDYEEDSDEEDDETPTTPTSGRVSESPEPSESSEAHPVSTSPSSPPSSLPNGEKSARSSTENSPAQNSGSSESKSSEALPDTETTHVNATSSTVPANEEPAKTSSPPPQASSTPSGYVTPEATSASANSSAEAAATIDTGVTNSDTTATTTTTITATTLLSPEKSKSSSGTGEKRKPEEEGTQAQTSSPQNQSQAEPTSNSNEPKTTLPANDEISATQSESIPHEDASDLEPASKKPRLDA